MNAQIYALNGNPLMRVQVADAADPRDPHLLRLTFLHDTIAIHDTLEHLEELVRLASQAIRDAKATPAEGHECYSGPPGVDGPTGETGIVALDARESGWTPPAVCFPEAPTREPNDTPTPVVRHDETPLGPKCIECGELLDDEQVQNAVTVHPKCIPF